MLHPKLTFRQDGPHHDQQSDKYRCHQSSSTSFGNYPRSETPLSSAPVNASLTPSANFPTHISPLRTCAHDRVTHR